MNSRRSIITVLFVCLHGETISCSTPDGRLITDLPAEDNLTTDLPIDSKTFVTKGPLDTAAPKTTITLKRMSVETSPTMTFLEIMSPENLDWSLETAITPKDISTATTSPTSSPLEMTSVKMITETTSLKSLLPVTSSKRRLSMISPKVISQKMNSPDAINIPTPTDVDHRENLIVSETSKDVTNPRRTLTSQKTFDVDLTLTSTSTISSSPSQKLPPGLQSLSLLRGNLSSFSLAQVSSSPSFLSFHQQPQHFLPLTPRSRFPAKDDTPRPLSQRFSEKQEGNNQEDLSSSTSWAPVLRKFSLTHDSDNILKLTGELGGPVYMPCSAHHSMEKQVSWVRRRDWHILTSGMVAYTREERFSVHHLEGSTEWTLVIKFVQLDDAGTYECQVATGNGILSRLVELEVVVPHAVIPGKGEYHIDAGSTITLDCYIQQSQVAPEYIFWYHNNRMINYDQERGGVSVKIYSKPQVRSQLTIEEATPTDSGNYTCTAANTQSASTIVYITNSNKIAAAVQPRVMSGGIKLCSSCASVMLLMLSLQLMLCLH